MNSKRIIFYCLLICLCMPTFAYAKIVFTSDRDGSRSLYMMDDDGSNIQRLTVTADSWPAWSPDGKHIAFYRYMGHDLRFVQIFAIHVINSDGTGEYRLTGEDAFERAPTWSPDGKYIAYNGAGIYLMDADGRRNRKFHHRGARPKWSVDSQSVVYTETVRNGLGEFVRDNIVIHNLKNDKRQILDTPDSWTIHSVCFMGPERVLFAAKYWDKENKNEKDDIYSYHLVTGEIINLTNNPDRDDFMMDWISDDVLPVTPKGNKTVTWGTLKQ